MSVINSMLRDLDRRHAPLPAGASVSSTFVQKQRRWPRSIFLLLTVVAAIVTATMVTPTIWSWPDHSRQTNLADTVKPVANTAILKPEKTETETPIKTDVQSAAVISAEHTENPAFTPAPLPQRPEESKGEELTARENNSMSTEKNHIEPKQKIISESTPVIKQERKVDDDVNAQRYQLARAALAQNQPQHAYEILRDNPPAIADARDYHAVLAAVEQQLGHYADASWRYQQLLALDQNQASWWLGLALSFEGERRDADAIAAYRQALALNSLPDAARQYALARSAVLDHSAEK